MPKESQGFHSCGRYYVMGEPIKITYIESLKLSLAEIRQNANKNKKKC